jgi:uncharacterized protein
MKLKVVEEDKSGRPWYADGLCFSCTQCGNCCTGGPGYVWTSDVEIDRFAAFLRMDRKEFLKKYCRMIGGRVSLKERKNHRGEYDCVFLEEIETEPGKRRRVCTVYDVRPLQCRTWPFWDGLLKSRKNWNAASEGCPGINKGKAYTKEQIEALRDAEDWPGYEGD